MSHNKVYEFLSLGYPGTICLSGPFLLFLIDSNALGGSMPLVSLLTTEEISDGICADKVECLSPCFSISFLKRSQAYLCLCATTLSKSFL